MRTSSKQVAMTVGRAIARSKGLLTIPFAAIVDQKSALEYIPEENLFWFRRCGDLVA
jgi:hypothetical protein